MLRSPLHCHEHPQEHSGKSQADDDPGVAPGDLASADQVIDQADQPGGEGCEPRPIRPGRMRRLGLIDPPPGSNDLSQKEIDQLLSPAPARTSIERSTLTLQGSDWPLVQALAEDGRAPYRQLAVRTHCHESTIRRRVEELIASGVLSFDVDLDTDAFGIRAPALLWMSVVPAKLTQIGQALAGRPEVPFCRHDRVNQPGRSAALPGRPLALRIPHRGGLSPRRSHAYRNCPGHASGQNARHHDPAPIVTGARADILVPTPVGGDTPDVLFLAGEPFPGRLACHAECFAYTCPADFSRSERGDVVSDGAVHVFVSSVGPHHLGEQLVV